MRVGRSGSGAPSKAFSSGRRRLVAFYCLGFLFAVAFAPHRHLNSFEDLITDGRSDSGVFLEAWGAADGETRIGGLRWVDDDPCLACFHHDYASSAIALFVLAGSFTSLEPVPPHPDRPILEPVPGSPASRSPPQST
jgi:hypothetical protein